MSWILKYYSHFSLFKKQTNKKKHYSSYIEEFDLLSLRCTLLREGCVYIAVLLSGLHNHRPQYWSECNFN